jgi:hypothetical protein
MREMGEKQEREMGRMREQMEHEKKEAVKQEQDAKQKALDTLRADQERML